MKAIILAAGLGTRLGNQGEDTPKCLLEIEGKTLLERHVDELNAKGIEEIYVVVGNNGKCWTKENHDRIKKINNNMIINFANHKTHNSYSLRLALDAIEDNEDALVLDGDVVLDPEIIGALVEDQRTVVLSEPKESDEFEGNKILSDEDGQVLELSRELTANQLNGQRDMYCGVKKINKQDIELFRRILGKHEYREKDLGFVLAEIIKLIPVYHYSDKRFVNINRIDELKRAKMFLCSSENSKDRRFIVLMGGYTASGKSTTALKIAKEMHADIFHSAVVRKELDLSPKTVEDADKFFDFKNNLREEVDRKVYGALAEKGLKSLKLGKNVVLDAGYFFKWQRELVYDIAKEVGAEVIAVRVICSDEEEIKRRMLERTENFGESELNETPSWNTYLATKDITESFGDEEFKNNLLSNIEFDTLNGSVKTGNEIGSGNLKNIIRSIKEKKILVQDENFNLVEGDETQILKDIKEKLVIALDFDGVITYPGPLKTRYINELGYNLREDQSEQDICIPLGVSEENYTKGSRRAYMEDPKVLPLEEHFLEVFNQLRKLENVALFILSSRYTYMIPHLEDFLRFHKLRFDGIVNTANTNKIYGLRKLGADVMVEDGIGKLKNILKEDSNFNDKCSLVLFRNNENKNMSVQNSPIIEVQNWRELGELLNKNINNANNSYPNNL